MPPRPNLSVLLLAALLAACGGKDSAAKVPLDQLVANDRAKEMQEAHSLLGPEARTALDSGNALFRRKEYAPALARYRAAAELAPQHSAPIFGIFMVARALNNQKLADSALVEIKKRNGSVTGDPHQFMDSAGTSRLQRDKRAPNG